MALSFEVVNKKVRLLFMYVIFNIGVPNKLKVVVCRTLFGGQIFVINS